MSVLRSLGNQSLSLASMVIPAVSSAVKRKKLLSSLCVGVVAVLLICSVSRWPEMYGFAASWDAGLLGRLLSLPVHLADDVMISLRSGDILSQLGYPAFNRSDLAQASTSYASPYLFAFLRVLAPQYVAIILYAVLGLLSVAATLALIFFKSRSSMNGLIVVLALLFSSTSREYSLNGWDHLFQALFLVLASAVFLVGRLGGARLLVISSSLALACLWRPDAVLISVAVLGWSLFEARRKIHCLLYGVLPFLAILLPFLAHNLFIFGHFTPTTARLKIGASPSLQYAFDYLVDNGFLQFSAITIAVLLALFYFLRLRVMGDRRCHVLVVSSVLTALASFVNSDAFKAGRMFWSPACVLALVCCSLAPPVLIVRPDSGLKVWDLLRLIRIHPFYRPGGFPAGIVLRSVSCGLAAALVLASMHAMADKARVAVITVDRVSAYPTASQYVLARWINQNLRPKDGPIGFFYLGVSYHLNRFEIVDFLGKADEEIAGTELKWGPPGHNKWDISASIGKWAPQAIIPGKPSDFSDATVLTEAARGLAEKRDFAFNDSLVLEPLVLREYQYCYVRPFRPDLKDQWGLFLRQDIARRIGQAATCRPAASGDAR